MKTYTVTLESREGKCKRVKVEAASAEMAMAVAAVKHRNWTPVEVT